ncbi:hypothetical protein XELAEV_18004478mg [Xenopus laevis]|uniref:G-protein coupled receptors family 3 profile domain-containing protein n=1 Tax=Xenopus laevis TaxID=8355 RepID=A0A974BRD5_XENLA|nr:hypothetical protein XELAEV_18004478mg [Xenopus laevis]
MLGVCNIFNVIEMLLYVTILCVGLGRIQSINPACHLEAIKSYKELEYVKEGDIMIGGVMTVHSNVYDLSTRSPFDTRDINDRLNYPELGDVLEKDCREFFHFAGFPSPAPSASLVATPSVTHRSHSEEHLKHLLDFRYVIEQINNSTTQLPNLTLGYHIHDSCGDTRKAVRSLFQILSGTRDPVPNYSCVVDRIIVGFIGDLSSKTTVPIAQILSLYGYSQISYGASDPSLSDRISFPYFFRTVQSDQTNYFTLVQLIKYFGWTWVGFITSDDVPGFYEHQIFTQYLSSQGICLEFTMYLNQNVDNADRESRKKIALSTSNVIIVGGTVSLLIVGKLDDLNEALAMKNVIFLPQWGTYLLHRFTSFKHFNSNLILYSLYPYNLDSPEIRQYYEQLHPSNNPEDNLLKDIWMRIFFCLSSEQHKNDFYEASHHTSLHNCTGEEYLANHETFKYFGSSPRMHLPVSIMTRTIVNLHAEIRKEYPQIHTRAITYRHKLHHYLKEMTVYITDGQSTKFDKNGNLEMDYGIFSNIIKFLNDGFKGTLAPAGKIRVRAPPDQQMEIKEDLITWNSVGSIVPRSQCSDNCLPGFWKATKATTQSCCYDCVSCSEGEISNTIASIFLPKCYTILIFPADTSSPIRLEEKRFRLNIGKGFVTVRAVKMWNCLPESGVSFFVEKKDHSLRPCIDIRELNKVTVKNHYSLPLISDLFQRLSHAMILSKLDLRGAYNLVLSRQCPHCRHIKLKRTDGTSGIWFIRVAADRHLTRFGNVSLIHRLIVHFGQLKLYTKEEQMIGTVVARLSEDVADVLFGVLLAGGVIYILCGILVLIPLCWITNIIIIKFYIPRVPSPPKARDGGRFVCRVGGHCSAHAWGLPTVRTVLYCSFAMKYAISNQPVKYSVPHMPASNGDYDKNNYV